MPQEDSVPQEDGVPQEDSVPKEDSVKITRARTLPLLLAWSLSLWLFRPLAHTPALSLYFSVSW